MSNAPRENGSREGVSRENAGRESPASAAANANANGVVRDIAAALRACGVRPGGVALVHSSLRSLGQVPGGADTVIASLREALGHDGTLMMCAHSWNSVTPKQPVFDVRTTPSCIGLIPEAFRLRAGVRRSLHPTHSVCGLGARVDALLDGHAQDNTPCGPNSPYRRLAEAGGQIIMLGCGLEPNTSMHGVEERVEPPYLFRDQTTPLTMRDENGREQTSAFRMHHFMGWRQRYDRVRRVMDDDTLHTGKVLAADVAVIEAAAMWERAERALRADPLFFVDRIS